MEDVVVNRRAFSLRKAHSLTGVLPIGVFLIEHLWTNASALGGRARFDRLVSDLQKLPALPVIEIVFIILPLAFHALYGVKLSFDARPDPVAYPKGKDGLYLAQRVTGFVALAFVCAHLWEFRVQKWLFGMSHHMFFDVAASDLSWSGGTFPIIGFAYIVALGCAIFHFANGLRTFASTWGIVKTDRARRNVAIASGTIGAALFYLGMSTVVYFATGTRLLPLGDSTVEAPCPDPGPPQTK